MSSPVFPPLFSGQAVGGKADPFRDACKAAAAGCDAGLVVHNLSADWFRAAIVFAPEVRLAEAMIVLPVCGIGLQNALGALAPPEIAVQLEWSGGIRVNGGSCGTLRPAAATADRHEVPDWLVIGLEIPVLPSGGEPGLVPDRTSLFEEGCADLEPVALLEAWTRHTLVWTDRWLDEGVKPVHREWEGLAYGLGEGIESEYGSGIMVGIDEHFSMILKEEARSRIVPLTELLDRSE